MVIRWLKISDWVASANAAGAAAGATVARSGPKFRQEALSSPLKRFAAALGSRSNSLGGAGINSWDHPESPRRDLIISE